MISEVERNISEVMRHIKNLVPQAVVHVGNERYENEDAVLTVYTPEELPEEIFDVIQRKTWEVELERGINIVVHVRDGESAPTPA